MSYERYWWTTCSVIFQLFDAIKRGEVPRWSRAGGGKLSKFDSKSIKATRNHKVSLCLPQVWPGETVFPDYTSQNCIDWWVDEYERFFGEIRHDALWIVSQFQSRNTKVCAYRLVLHSSKILTLPWIGSQLHVQSCSRLIFLVIFSENDFSVNWILRPIKSTKQSGPEEKKKWNIYYTVNDSSAEPLDWAHSLPSLITCCWTHNFTFHFKHLGSPQVTGLMIIRQKKCWCGETSL